jgi:hypothetical protein
VLIEATKRWIEWIELSTALSTVPLTAQRISPTSLVNKPIGIVSTRIERLRNRMETAIGGGIKIVMTEIAAIGMVTEIGIAAIEIGTVIAITTGGHTEIGILAVTVIRVATATQVATIAPASVWASVTEVSEFLDLATDSEARLAGTEDMADMARTDTGIQAIRRGTPVR